MGLASKYGSTSLKNLEAAQHRLWSTLPSPSKCLFLQARHMAAAQHPIALLCFTSHWGRLGLHRVPFF